jgi:thiamine biosynthesis lipoprotein
MHTSWDFSLPARDEAQARALVERAITLVRELDATLAFWQPASELSRLNASAGTGRALTVSAALDTCLREALRVHAASGGALDPSVGPLTQAWWQARQSGRLLKDAERRRLLGLLGANQVRRVEVEAHGGASLHPAWILDKAGLRLDLGAVAKGYAQDRVAALFESAGVHAFLLNAGGQIYARGRKPDGSPWRVGILHPRAPDRVMAVLQLSDACLSTSGDYEQVSVIQGRRVHHILDPRTGLSVEHMASASALLRFKPGDPDPGLRSDAASTAAFVLGGQAGLDFLRSQGMEGLLVTEDTAGLHALKSEGFKNVDVVLELD